MISLLDDDQGENGFFGAAAELSGRPFVDHPTKKVVRGRREVRAVDGRGLPSGLDSESAPKEVVGLLSTSPTLVPPARPWLRSAYIHPRVSHRVRHTRELGESGVQSPTRRGHREG